MTFRIRYAILGVTVTAAAIALAAGGLAPAAMARLGSVMVPAQAAVHPTVVDESGRFRSDPGWGTAVGALPVPASMAARSESGTALIRAAVPLPVSGYVPLAPSVPAASSTLRDLNLSRAGFTSAPGCSGSSCGTDGCGFLAPGCSLLLDCGLLNPACGLGVPVSSCGLIDPSCSRSGCGAFLSGCGFGDDEFDRDFRFRDRFLFDHFHSDDHRHFFDDHHRRH
jgi:hypothetical protein